MTTLREHGVTSEQLAIGHDIGVFVQKMIDSGRSVEDVISCLQGLVVGYLRGTGVPLVEIQRRVADVYSNLETLTVEDN